MNQRLFCSPRPPTYLPDLLPTDLLYYTDLPLIPMLLLIPPHILPGVHAV